MSAAAFRNTLTIVLAGGQGERLYPLTRHRAKPAVPFGGIYRIIDFTLSNCLNSDLRRIEVLTQYKSLSLSRHLRLAWDVFNYHLGEYINNSPPQQRLRKTWYQGTADAIYQNVYTLENVRPSTVLILSGDHIYKMDYRKMLAFHWKKKAGVTIGAVVVPREEASAFGILEKDRNDRVVGFQEKPADPKPIPGDPDHCLVSMGIYAFDTEVLIRRVMEDARSVKSSHDFGKDILPEMVRRKDDVYVFSDWGGRKPYWRDVGTIDAFFESHMDLLGEKPAFDLSDRAWPMHTYVPPLAPPLIRRAGHAERSLVSAGCVIDGAHLENAVLSPDVRVERGAVVKDAILMDGVRVGAGARVERTIVDKRVTIPAGRQIAPDKLGDAHGFTVSKGGILVIPKEEPL